MRNVLNILDLTTEEIDELISVAEDIAANPEKLVSAMASSTVIKTAMESAVKAGASVAVDDKTKEDIRAAASAYTSKEDVTKEQKETIENLLKLFGVK